MRPALTSVILLALTLLVAVAPSPATAQDLGPCSEIGALAASGDIQGALTELDWCERALNEMYYDGLVETLSVEIMGYAPGEGTVEAVLGFSNVEITHSRDGTEIRTTFTSGTGGADSPMAGLGALANLGASLGVRQPGVEQVRLGRLTGRLEDKGNGTYSLMVTLSGGEVLTHEGPDGDALQRFATETIRLLNAYLGG